MGFKRWGFRGAQPQFQPADRGLVDASKLFTFQVGDRDVRGVEAARENSSVYRLDIDGIDCADARLIAAAPELLEACELFAAYDAGDMDDDVAMMVAYAKARDAVLSAIAKATHAPGRPSKDESAVPQECAPNNPSNNPS